MRIEKNTRVFITGAASGIGRATALEAASRGADLFLVDVNEESLAQTCEMAERTPGRVCLSQALDIRDFEAVMRFAAETHQKHGPIDILVNNAGIALFALVEHMSHDHWRKVIDTNLWGAIHCIEAFVPQMIKAKKGHIVNVSSTAGLAGLPWHAAYSTAKWGLVGLSEVLRYDLARHNIGVTVVCPGAVNTPIKNSAQFLGTDRGNPRVKRMIRLFDRHAVSPERVAKLIADGIEKERFMVITSLDIKLMYLLKRCCPPAYHLLMKQVSRMMNSMEEKEGRQDE